MKNNSHYTLPKINNETLASYILGFLLSVILTLLAYLGVINHLFPVNLLLIFIVSLGLIQLVVQLVFFLHLLKEKRPRWNFVIFIATISMILAVVVGSIWIMNHLNYNMTPQSMNSYILDQEGMRK